MPPTLWYYEHEGKPGGPVTVSQLRQLASSGQLLPTDKVRKDDMTKWVKARAVKGLFAADVMDGGDVLTSPSTVEGEIETGASVFDFFGTGAAIEGEKPPEENTVFDFFHPNAAPAPSPAPPLAAKSKAKAADEETVPVAAPAPVVSGENVSGPAVELFPDGRVALTGGRTTLALTGRWLRAHTLGTDGLDRLACLRLSRLDAAFFGGRAEAHAKSTHQVLSFHVGTQALAVTCAEGSEKAFRTFLEKVLGQKG
ncbi:MAG: DUF4339 domain-containing protein [Gemmataceae bacterium]